MPARPVNKKSKMDELGVLLDKYVPDAGRDKIANKLKYGKMEQELSELHALMDNIPPEIIAAYRRRTVGLQSER